MRIAVDTKNFALYSGGIANFFKPILRAWVAARPRHHFTLIGPPFADRAVYELPNCDHRIVDWPWILPRQLRPPFYDNFLFPGAIRAARPELVFTPYHDVRLPRDVTSAMMIHDTCFDDLPSAYPVQIRKYYQHMLRVNIRRASHVLTVSEASRLSVMRHYQVAAERIDVVPNAADVAFLRAPQTALPERTAPNRLSLFYPSGSEGRKNVRRLLEALELLVGRGFDVTLAATGERNAGWDDALAGLPSSCEHRVTFLGRLETSSLPAHYLAADVVVYPTLCEGFGRVCLEAMELGVPLACSNIEVLKEVATDYPSYFDPRDASAIADAIVGAARGGRQRPRRDPRFELEAVEQQFIATMDKIVAACEKR